MPTNFDPQWEKALSVVQEVQPPTIPDGAHAMTVVIDYPPGSAGAPPHKHPGGPAFGYMLEGEMLFELEGEPPRVIRAGEAFWEPGGDVIHYSDANNRDDMRCRFTVTMLLCARPADAHRRRRRGACRAGAPTRTRRFKYAVTACTGVNSDVANLVANHDHRKSR